CGTRRGLVVRWTEVPGRHRGVGGWRRHRNPQWPGAQSTRDRTDHPGLWNAHTHLGDAVITQELTGTLEELVAPPHGLKHRILAKAKDDAVIGAMRRAMATMLRTGTTGFSDFREGGLKGLKLMYAAVAAMPLQGVALGRPMA